MRIETHTQYFIEKDDIEIGKELYPDNREIETIFEPIIHLPVILTENIHKDGYELRYATKDNDPIDPRLGWDPIDHMICLHRRYTIGDKHNIKAYDFNSQEELNELLSELYGEVLVELPIYLYDHSGIQISTRSFHDHWDSGQIGVIFMTEKDAREYFSMYGERYCSADEIRERAISHMNASIEEYNYYLADEVFMLVREQLTVTFESIDFDSCSGFFGTENVRKILRDDW